MRYFIELGYHGKAYHGWQIQDNAITVQQLLNHALSCLLKEVITTIGQGRTDTGVHCIKMYAHFDTGVIIFSDLVSKLNYFLPEDIVIYSIKQVNEKAHARFDALSRTYEYRIHTQKSPFLNDTSVFIYKDMNVELMQKAADLLIREADFECFSKKGVVLNSFICNVYQAEFTYSENTLLFTIKANRFLRNMVRAIVGTLFEVGKGKCTLIEFEKIIQSKDRSKAGSSAPAKGLFLINQEYPDWIWDTDITD